MKVELGNGRVITPFRLIERGSVVVEDGRIADVLEDGTHDPEARYIDVGGMVISPGFIDMHVHGGGNAEVMEGTADAVRTMCRAHSRYGTTAILPTTLAAPWSDIYQAIDAVREAQAHSGGAKILGVHLEGPYFSIAQRGAQSAEYIIEPRPEDYMKLLDYWDGIALVAVAPEVKGALALGRELRRRKIVASIAHTDANYDEVVKALENGFTNITHFYSGCSIVHRENAYRIAGVVESGYLLDDLTVQVIADGKHLPASLLKLIYKVKGADRIALITDGLGFSAAPLQEQAVYTQKNGVEVVLEDGVMKLPDRTSFAGSVATTNQLVRNMIHLAGATLGDAVKMASYTPAKILNIADRKGILSPGMDADIVVFDDNINVKLTMVEGRVVYADGVAS